MQFLRMIRSVFKVTVPCTILAGISVSANANIVIGSFDNSHSEAPFSGSDYSDLQTDLANPVNFGTPTSIVKQGVTVQPGVSTISASYLAGINVFVVEEAYELSATEQNLLVNFEENGGKLVLISDSTIDSEYGANAILDALGGGTITYTYPAGGDNGTANGAIVGTGTATDGPFGDLGATSTFAATKGSTLNLTAKTTLLGQTSGKTFNLIGEIAPGVVGSGSVLVVTDVIFQNYSLSTNPNNAVLFENFIAPEPTSLSVLALGAVGLLGRRRA